MRTRRRKKSPKDKFSVTAALTNFDLPKAGAAVTLKIYRRGKKLGELEIGRGSISWFGAYWQNAEPMNSGKFAAMMDRETYDSE
jgi:hypothetical protein